MKVKVSPAYCLGHRLLQCPSRCQILNFTLLILNLLKLADFISVQDFRYEPLLLYEIQHPCVLYQINSNSQDLHNYIQLKQMKEELKKEYERLYQNDVALGSRLKQQIRDHKREMSLDMKLALTHSNARSQSSSSLQQMRQRWTQNIGTIEGIMNQLNEVKTNEKAIDKTLQQQLMLTSIQTQKLSLKLSQSKVEHHKRMLNHQRQYDKLCLILKSIDGMEQQIGHIKSTNNGQQNEMEGELHLPSLKQLNANVFPQSQVQALQSHKFKYTEYFNRLTKQTLQKNQRLQYLHSQKHKLINQQKMLKHKQNEIMKDDTIYDIREKEYYVKGELLQRQNQLNKLQHLRQVQYSDQGILEKQKRRIQKRVNYVYNKENKQIKIMKSVIQKIHTLFKMANNQQTLLKIQELVKRENLQSQLLI